MQYDQQKDVVIKLFEMKQEGDNKSLLISVMAYNGGEPKLQITRMYKKKDETVGYGKMGRLDINELQFIKDYSDEILDTMKKWQTKNS